MSTEVKLHRERDGRQTWLATTDCPDCGGYGYAPPRLLSGDGTCPTCNGWGVLFATFAIVKAGTK